MSASDGRVESAEREHPRLCDFIRSRQDNIIDSWTQEARHLSPSQGLPRSVLIDHLPEVISRIAAVVGAVHTGREASLEDTPRIHAIDRLAHGFTLDDLIKEYGLLRLCILGLWEREIGASIQIRELIRLESAIDLAISESVVRYSRAQERTLKALDRISEAAQASGDPGTFLSQLLRAMVETTEAVDIAALFLREGDQLRIRAAVGLDEDLEQGLTLAIDDSFTGRIATEAAPLFTRTAATDPRVKSVSIRRRGVRALYGVPLLHERRVIGVAEVGSDSAHEFSDEDKLLLRTMANRAAAVIIQAELLRQREQAEKEVRESEARFRALADNIPQLAWMADGNGWIFWYNKRWFEYTGTRLEEMQGWSWQTLLHPDHVRRVVEKVRRQFEVGEFWEDTFPLRGRDGRYRWFLSRAVPLRDEHNQLIRWLGTNTDVTEEHFRREAISLLGTSLDFRKTLARIAKLAVPALTDLCLVEIVTPAGQLEQVAVEHVDPSKVELAHELRRRFPPDPDEPRGTHHVLRTTEPELYPDISEELLVQSAKSAEHLELIRRLEARSAMVVPLVAHGRSLGVISFVSSESGRRYTPRDLEIAQELAAHAALALDNARLLREAQDAVHARDEILAIVSHDLRNPLGVINMSAALLLQREIAKDPSSRKHLEVIQRSAGRMESLIADLLDMASIQAGRLAIDKEPHDAEALVQEAIDLHEALAAEKGIEVRRDVRVAGFQLRCDRERMLQVFSNLLGNAIKFCHSGDRVSVVAVPEGRVVRFTVSDTGPGITGDELPHIFEPYWSAGRDAKRSTGLGLFITRGLIDAHGGRIWAESRPGAGSAFHFTLPAVPAEARQEGGR